MIIFGMSDLPSWVWWLSLLVLGYTTGPRTWIPGELVTASMMNGIRDLFLDIEAGNAEMVRVLLAGKTSAELEALQAGAGQAAVGYDTDQAAIVVSLNGSAFVRLGGDLLNDPILAGGTRFSHFGY